ncbi:hypothetical protein N0V90_007628 [Kalmusia sp. IMI 367209]|nr:hypothetical protein N0V90_007628 [Kalmusia sp. IMI 367209]
MYTKALLSIVLLVLVVAAAPLSKVEVPDRAAVLGSINEDPDFAPLEARTFIERDPEYAQINRLSSDVLLTPHEERGLVEEQHKRRGIVRPEDRRGIVRPEDKRRGIVRPEDKRRGIVRPEDRRGIVRPEDKRRGIVRPEDRRGIVRPEDKRRGIVRPEG